MKKGLFGLVCLFVSAFVSHANAQTTALPADSLVVIYDTICGGETYVSNGCEFLLPTYEGTVSGMYVDTLLECRDTIDMVPVLFEHHIAIIPLQRVQMYDTLAVGDTLYFADMSLTASGRYEHTFASAAGCDSIVELYLHVRVEPVVVKEMDVAAVCMGTNALEMYLDIDGRVDSLEFTFDTDSAITGLCDTIIPMPIDGYVHIQYGDVPAGKYKCRLRGYVLGTEVFTQTISVEVHLSADVLEKRWDDVIVVLAYDYNGGYNFTSFQWYKNGEPLVGEVNHYLNQTLEEEAEYSCLLTDENGNQVKTCPIIVEGSVDVIVSPTLLRREQQARCYLSEDARVFLYDAMGHHVLSLELSRGETFLPLFANTGVYLMKVITQANQQRIIKLVVW